MAFAPTVGWLIGFRLLVWPLSSSSVWVPETNGRSLEEIGADLRGTAFGGEEGGTADEWTSEVDSR